MNRTRTNAFQIDGKPMPAPDRDMESSYEDIDSSDTGRTLDGVMHRDVLRFDVAKWSFVYSTISAADYNYLQSLFKGKKEFQFTFPTPTGSKMVKAYRSKWGISLRNYTTGEWKNYKFNIIEC